MLQSIRGNNVRTKITIRGDLDERKTHPRHHAPLPGHAGGTGKDRAENGGIRHRQHGGVPAEDGNRRVRHPSGAAGDRHAYGAAREGREQHQSDRPARQRNGTRRDRRNQACAEGAGRDPGRDQPHPGPAFFSLSAERRIASQQHESSPCTGTGAGPWRNVSTPGQSTQRTRKRLMNTN